MEHNIHTKTHRKSFVWEKTDYRENDKEKLMSKKKQKTKHNIHPQNCHKISVRTSGVEVV